MRGNRYHLQHREKSGSWLRSLGAAVIIGVTAVLSFFVNRATSVVPKSWSWAYNWRFTIIISLCLVVLAIILTWMHERSRSSKNDSILGGSALTTPIVGMINAGTVEFGTYESSNSSHYGSTSDSEVDPLTNIPPRNRLFTGREGYIKNISRRHGKGKAVTVALRGLGGIGKTQIALEYAYRHLGDYSITWWIQAESEIQMRADLMSLGGSLGLPSTGGNDISEILVELTKRKNWLIIFDNAPDKESLYGFVPRGRSRCDVLITSRSRDWAEIAETVDVSEMEPRESTDFLAKRTGRRDEDVAHLASTLGHLPLALAQAGAYIYSHNISIRNYLSLYREAAARMLAARPFPIDYPKSVAATWLLHFDVLKAEQPAAVELLQLCAFVAPDRIPLRILTSDSSRSFLPRSLSICVSDSHNWELTVGALVSNSLVDRLTDDTVRVHRLVQEVTRSPLQGKQLNAWVSRLVKILQQAFPSKTDTQEEWQKAHELAGHALVAVARAEEREVCLRQTAQLLHALANYRDERGECEQSINLLKRAVAANRSAYSETHYEVAWSLATLGYSLSRHQEYHYARATFLEASRIARISLDQNDCRWSYIHSGNGEALARPRQVFRGEFLLS